MKYIVAAIESLHRQSSLFHPLYTPGTFFLIKKQICHRWANKCSNSPLPTLAQRSTAAVGTGEAQSLSLFQKTTSQSRYLYNDFILPNIEFCYMPSYRGSISIFTSLRNSIAVVNQTRTQSFRCRKYLILVVDILGNVVILEKFTKYTIFLILASTAACTSQIRVNNM